jgi:hypothetical protein
MFESSAPAEAETITEKGIANQIASPAPNITRAMRLISLIAAIIKVALNSQHLLVEAA